MAKLTTDQALESVYADRLERRQGYVRVPTALFVEKVDVNMAPLPPVAFYRLEDDGRDPVLLRKGDQPYSPLVLSQQEFIWIEDKDAEQIRRYAEGRILASTTTGTGASSTAEAASNSKLETLRKSAILVVEDLFQNPSPENIKKSTKVVGSFVYVLMRDPKAYLFLSKLSSHDPYTLQHSVGASVNSIILARKIGITAEAELQEIGLGGLLHDIGKVHVKQSIINKEGPLDEFEWEEMRGHSEAGYNIVAGNPTISERTKRAILEHHEDKNGTGYPHQRRLDDIDIASRIVALADIFNALTTTRSYAAARTPFDAFQLMREKLQHKIDDELFKQMVMIYGGTLPKDQAS